MTANRMTGSFVQTTLTNGDAQIFNMVGAPLPATVWARPASGDTVAVSISFDGTNYIAWAKGSVTAADYDTLNSGVVSIKFQRTAGSGTTSTCGVC